MDGRTNKLLSKYTFLFLYCYFILILNKVVNDYSLMGEYKLFDVLLISISIIAIPIALYLYIKMFAHMLKQYKGTNKTIWFLALILTLFIGATVYYFAIYSANKG